jgi:hypothetical protein
MKANITEQTLPEEAYFNTSVGSTIFTSSASSPASLYLGFECSNYTSVTLHVIVVLCLDKYLPKFICRGFTLRVVVLGDGGTFRR